jgi:CheY-like chemotaxis protein
MEVVFSNVLRNAIRFTPPGGEIDVRGQRSTQNPEHLTLDVTDTGIGIPPDYVVRVTEKYFRVGDFVDGTGLGLSIAKEVVEGHGGRIDIRSPPPGCAAGTRVTITLPAAVPPLILVVDDAPDVRDLLECHLCLYGFRVVKCASGEEALQSMGLERPDMMILDLFMPGMGGEGVILQMKADPSLRTVPMVVMTGALDKPSREMLDAFGVPAFLKPLREKELLDCVEEAMVGSATLRSPSDRKRTKERT